MTTGVRVIDNRLRVGLAVAAHVGRALDKAAGAGANYYRENVPVREGRLKRSVRRFGNPGQLLRAWGSDPSAPHSRYVEFGTRKMRARPRLRESVQIAGQTLLQELK